MQSSVKDKEEIELNEALTKSLRQELDVKCRDIIISQLKICTSLLKGMHIDEGISQSSKAMVSLEGRMDSTSDVFH